MIASGRFETVALDVVYRQAKGSSIISNATSINAGKKQLVYDDHFEVITVDSEQAIQKKVVELMQRHYDPRNIFSAQVLSSTKQGQAGVVELNAALQRICNYRASGSSPNSSIHYGSYGYSVGDKIMMTANNYRAGYFNGDIGVINAINAESLTITFGETVLEISKNNLSDMTLALATTIHKSQGSEFSTVIIALPANPSIMLQRNLLYTAITRAKKNIIIVEERGAIDKAISTVSNTKRTTMLLNRLRVPKCTQEPVIHPFP